MEKRTNMMSLVIFLSLIFAVNSAESQGIVEKMVKDLGEATIQANEKGARAGVKTIIVAVETYKSVKGNYPKNEDDLINARPPYYQRPFDNNEFNGYKYSVDFKSDGYKIIATPIECGKTGNKIFMVDNIKKEVILESLSAKQFVEQFDKFAEESISESRCE